MRHTTTALAAALLLGLTACTADNPPSSASSKPGQDSATDRPADATLTAGTEAPAAELERAVRAYSAAYFKPDATAAYGMLSARCKTEVDATMYEAVVETTVKDYGHQEIKTLKVDQAIGNLARVSYTYSVPRLDQKSQPWTREGGEWRYDAC